MKEKPENVMNLDEAIIVLDRTAEVFRGATGVEMPSMDDIEQAAAVASRSLGRPAPPPIPKDARGRVVDPDLAAELGKLASAAAANRDGTTIDASTPPAKKKAVRGGL